MARDWNHLQDRKPVGQLSADPWLTSPELGRLVAALQADGAEVRLVGGCVRDGLLRRPVQDVDLATPDPPETVTALLQRAAIQTVPWARGVAHGTVLAVVGHTSFEITTLRRDVACDGRYAEVAFTDDWTEDAARRDFTINALSATLDGAVYDYFDGIADLSAGHVRFVGRAVDRIGEDALRILRFFRFHAHYGLGGPDMDALSACQIMVPNVLDLSGERIRTELLKTLAAPDPASAMLLMRGVRLLDHILPEATRFGVLRVLAFLETRGVVVPGVAPDPLRRLAALVRTDGPGGGDMAARLRLSRAETRRLESIAATPQDQRPRPDLNGSERRRLLDRIGPALFRDLCLVDWAAERDAWGRTDSARSAGWMAQLDGAAAFDPPPFPLNGNDLAAVGVPRGPAVGQALASLRDWWLAEDFRPDRTALLARLGCDLQQDMRCSE